MKAIVKDILLGFGIFVIIMILEFLVTLPFGEPAAMDAGELGMFLNREFLLTAVPAAIVTYLFARFSEVQTIVSAYRRSITWTLMILVFYVIIAVGNDNVGPIFGSYGFYVLLAGIFAGPILYAKIERLE